MDEAIDRAHRIGGKVKDDDTGEVRQAMIVKFLTWKNRTAVYKGRKKSEDKKIQLDQTAKRVQLLKFAREKTESDDHIDFIFADINCMEKGFLCMEKGFLGCSNKISHSRQRLQIRCMFMKDIFFPKKLRLVSINDFYVG